MWKNYWLTAWRNIARHKSYSFITIAGLAIGIACAISIFLFIQYERSFDGHNDNFKRIYRVGIEFHAQYLGEEKASAVTPAPLAAALEQEFPEVSHAARVTSPEGGLIAGNKKSFMESNFFFADPKIFEIFTFTFVSGTPEQALVKPFSVVITRAMAEKYFGSGDPVGKVLRFQNEYDFQITAMIENMPAKSHFRADFFASFKTYERIFQMPVERWGMCAYYTYMLMREGASAQSLESKLPALLKKYWNGDKKPSYRFFLQPLSQIHLYSKLMGELNENGDALYVIIFSIVALLILFIACINYVNLTTARSLNRLREVGIRKLVGAGRSQIIRQFIGEAVLISMIAYLLAFILVQAALPFLSTLLERDLRLTFQSSMFSVLPMFFALGIGLAAGFIPALSFSTIKPITALNRALFQGASKSRVRNALVVVQFAIAIILIIFTLVVKDQLHFVKNKNMGYGKDHILTIAINDEQVQKKLDAFKSALSSNPHIRRVASSISLPNNIMSQTIARWPGMPANLEINIYANTVDYDFIDLYGIPMAGGRNFSREFPADMNGAYLINESAQRALGWDQPVGREFLFRAHGDHGKHVEYPGRIVGVMKDFHSRSLHYKIEPLFLFLGESSKHRVVSIKMDGNNIPATIAFIKNTWRTFSGSYPLEYGFFDQEFLKAYLSEQRLGRIFSIFSLFAVFVACLGLFGLSSFTVERRTKEIGIRKVLGASVSSILALVIQEYGLAICFSMAIACPVAFVIRECWLNNFAYRIPMDLVVFIFAAAITIGAAFFSISFQSIRAARRNPVDSLRYE